MDIDKISELLANAQHILILQADNPDGDSLASALALEQIVHELGKEPYLYCGVEMPTYLRYLRGWDRVNNELPHQFDLSIIVDTSALSLFEVLAGKQQLGWLRAKPCIVLDHHTNENSIDFATVLVNQRAVATGEIIYELAQQLQWPVNHQAGEMMATSILSDSLGLTSEGTTVRSIHIIAELVERGVKLAELENRRRETMRKSPDLVHYKGELLQRVEYHSDDRIATVMIPWKEIEQYSPFYNPTMLVLDDMRLTEKTDVAIGFKVYQDGKVTAKIRCNFGKTIADKLAEHFGGGGHPYASGFKITDGRPYNEIKAECIRIAAELLIGLNRNNLMKLYNTLTRSVDELQLLQSPLVTVYTCGPTVYDYAHIGHWFNYVRMDTLIRVLKTSGLEPKWVMNITDVGHLVSDADEGEDKLEKGARREGKTAWEVAEHYTKDFLECMQLLNMLEPDHIVKATEHIQEQIELIERLEAKGYTYVIDDGVYYDTSKFEGYAAFARLDLDDQQEGARVAVNPQKRNPSDFALWKLSPKGHQRDMEWDSPWGKGFPGWHIECSAMSMKYLGETLDIHTGGIDHIPVHHTNEIAQSEAATGKRFANYWLHSNHVMVNGEKISKSLGNGIRLQEILEKGISAEAVRLNVLESHYRSQSKFSWDSLEAATNRLKTYQAMADLKWQLVGEEPARQRYTHWINILGTLQDDLNTALALSLTSELADDLLGKLPAAEEQAAFQELLQRLDAVFGLNLANRPDLSDEQKTLLAARHTARGNKDWAGSDKLRDQLAEQSIGVRDTPHGQIWFRL